MEATVEQMERLQLLQAGKKKRGRPPLRKDWGINIEIPNASTRRRSLVQKRRWARVRRASGKQEA